jgi:hypothetical protein
VARSPLEYSAPADYPHLQADSIQTLSAQDAHTLWKRATECAGDHVAGRTTARGALETIVASAGLLSAIPPAVALAIRRFQLCGNADGALVVRGLLPGHVDVGPTPETPTEAASRPVTFATRLILVALASLLGDPFAVAHRRGGALVPDVYPIADLARQQKGSSSDAQLDWHVDDAYIHEMRCGYVALLCLRADAATTLISAAREVRLDARTTALLREERFVTEEDVPEDERVLHIEQRVAVLAGPADDPRITLDPIYMRPVDPADREGRPALDAIIEQIRASSHGHELQRGDLLLIDNLRTLHGRTAFRARYDGTDRWLERVRIGISPQQVAARDRRSPVISVG